MPMTRARIAQIAEKLRKMPPAPPAEVNVTKQEAVRLLESAIAGQQRKGYTRWSRSWRASGAKVSISRHPR